MSNTENHKTERLEIRIEPWLRKYIDEVSDELNMDRSKVVGHLIEEFCWRVMTWKDLGMVYSSELTKRRVLLASLDLEGSWDGLSVRGNETDPWGESLMWGSELPTRFRFISLYGPQLWLVHLWNGGEATEKSRKWARQQAGRFYDLLEELEEKRIIEKVGGTDPE